MKIFTEKGIERPEDLIKFTADHNKMIIKNLSHWDERVLEGNDGHTVPTSLFKFRAKAITRL